MSRKIINHLSPSDDHDPHTITFPWITSCTLETVNLMRITEKSRMSCVSYFYGLEMTTDHHIKFTQTILLIYVHLTINLKIASLSDLN